MHGDRRDCSVGAIWYLPHHPVLNTNKPGKVHVVFDCAAKLQGTSLNDQLLEGPDLTNNLVGILMCFRQEPVALLAEVELTFHQVCVSSNDCDALRFLWQPNNDLNCEPEEYQMMVHQAVLTSVSCQKFRKEAVDIVHINDCLKSVPSETEGIGLVSELHTLLSNGGFHLTKWISNSRKVIYCIPLSERVESVKYLLLD